jgi:hypothetical protein
VIGHDHALVPLSPRVSLARLDDPGIEWAVIVAGLVSTTLFIGGLPIAAMLVMIVWLIAGLVVGARRAKQPQIAAPEMIRWPEARHTYRAMLNAFSEIEDVVSRAPRTRPATLRIVERCRSAVEMCGRMALVLEPLQRYLEHHDPDASRAELDRLRMRRSACLDEATRNVLDQAAVARQHQLAACGELQAMRERILARFELVHATFEAFAGLLVKLEASEEEQVARGDDTLDDQLASIDSDLHAIEAVLADEHAN